MFQLKWFMRLVRQPVQLEYTQSSGSIIDYVILRIFVLLALCICWSWSLNSDECEAKRAFDSQSHQFDRGEIVLLPFRDTLFIARNNNNGNDNNIISGLGDNTGSFDNIITDDNSMGDIDWYYYYDLQDGELEIDYDAMTIRPPRYLPTVIPSYTHGCRYFMCSILLSTRHESQYVHKCHRCHLMSNNGECSDRVYDTHEDNDHLYDHMAGYYAYPSAGVPEDVLATIIYQSSKRGDDLDVSATAMITGEMPEQVTNGSDCKTYVTLMEEAINVSTVLAIHSFVGIGIKRIRVTVILQQDRPFGETTRLIVYLCHYCYSRYDKFESRCMIAYPTAMITLWDDDVNSCPILAYGSLLKATSTPAPMDAQPLFDGHDVGSTSTLLHGTLRLIEWIDVTTWTQCLIARRPISLHMVRQICFRYNRFFGNVPSPQMVTKYGESSCIMNLRQEDVCNASLFLTEVESLDINFLGLSRSYEKEVFNSTMQGRLVPHQICRLVCLVRSAVNGESSAFDWSQFVPYTGTITGNTVTSWRANTCETSYVGYFFMSRENEEPVSCSIKPKEQGEHNVCVHCVVVLKEHGESTVCSINTQHPPHCEIALRLGFSTSSALHTTLITSTNIVDPWGAIVDVMRRPTYTRLTTAYHISTWFGYYYCFFVVTSCELRFSTDTIPLHMHSCRCSNHDGGDFPWIVSSNLDMDTYDKLVTTSCVPTWRDSSGSTVESTAKKTKPTAFAMLCYVSGIHTKTYGYGNVGMPYDSPQRLGIMKDGAFHTCTIMSDVPDVQYVERDRLLPNKQDAAETATVGTDSVICATSYELEKACGYCNDQSSNNGIGSPYKPSRDGEEYSVVISNGGYHSDAIAHTIKSSLSYYADTQVCMHDMHNSHLMHLVTSQDHGEPIGCILRWRRQNGEPIDCIVKTRKYGERIVCIITPQHSLLRRDVAIHIIATRIESITETRSVDDNFNNYVETIGAKACVIGDYDVNMDNNITSDVGKSYTNGAVDWGAVFEPITNIYGNYCAAWKAQRKSSPPMHDTSVTAYASSHASTYASSSLYAINQRSLFESLRLLLPWMQPFETSSCEDNRRSIDSDAVYAWTTSETSKDDVAVEVEEQGLNDDTNMSSCAPLVNGEHLLRGMIKETDTNSTDRSLLLGIHLIQQLMMCRFDYLAYAPMQLSTNLAQYCVSHEHHVIMTVFCIILHALIAPIIVPMNPYDASATTTKLELQAYGMRKDITPPDEHNSTVVEEHPTSIEAERSYGGINLSGPRTRCVLTDDVFTDGLNTPTVDLYSCLLSKIKNLHSYLGLLSSECMPQHPTELCRNDSTSSGRIHDTTIVNFISDTRSKNATYTNHFMLPYNFALENISSGTLRLSAMVENWTFRAISI
jgi:hypothetical protein